MATHSSILAWVNSMDRRTWWAIVHGLSANAFCVNKLHKNSSLLAITNKAAMTTRVHVLGFSTQPLIKLREPF